MLMKLIPILTPGIDLRAFTGLLGADAVNVADGKHIPPLSKFAELVDAAFLPGFAPKHMFFGFYFEIPFVVESELHQFQYASLFRLSCYADNFTVNGIISGPMDLWKDFIIWSTTEDQSQWMWSFGDALYGYFKQFPYFQDLHVSTFRDQTFGLSRVK